RHLQIAASDVRQCQTQKPVHTQRSGRAGRIGISFVLRRPGTFDGLFPATAGNGPLDYANLTTIGRFRNQGQLSNSGKNEGPAARVDGPAKRRDGFAPSIGRSWMSRHPKWGLHRPSTGAEGRSRNSPKSWQLLAFSRKNNPRLAVRMR